MSGYTTRHDEWSVTVDSSTANLQENSDAVTRESAPFFRKDQIEEVFHNRQAADYPALITTKGKHPCFVCIDVGSGSRSNINSAIVIGYRNCLSQDVVVSKKNWGPNEEKSDLLLIQNGRSAVSEKCEVYTCRYHHHYRRRHQSIIYGHLHVHICAFLYCDDDHVEDVGLVDVHYDIIAGGFAIEYLVQYLHEVR